MVSGAGRIHCTWCGAVVTGGRRFCAACGKPVVEDDEDKEYRDDDFVPAGVGAPYARTVYRPATRSRDALDATSERERSPGLLARSGSALAAVVAIPLGLIMIVVSTVLPILLVLALIMGPGDTLNMVRAWIPGSGGETRIGTCEGFDDWFQASNDRGNTLYARA